MLPQGKVYANKSNQQTKAEKNTYENEVMKKLRNFSTSDNVFFVCCSSSFVVQCFTNYAQNRRKVHSSPAPF